MKYVVIHERADQLVDTGCMEDTEEVRDKMPEILSAAKAKYSKEHNISCDIVDLNIYIPLYFQREL